MKLSLAVLFGGKSVEHEVSVISALQAVQNLNKEKYDITCIYITRKNEMFAGEGIDKIESYKNVPELLKKATKVTFVKDDDKVKLVQYPGKKFGKSFEKEIDVAFPIVHGTNVEDGTLQGYLKTLGLPFVGCDVTASAVGMDKYVMKPLLKYNDIPVLDALLFTYSDYAQMDATVKTVEEKLGYPVIVKPVNLGSSVGIKVAKDKDALYQALDDAFSYSGKVLVEHAIMKLREINCAVLGDENEAIASECEEPFHADEILSYKDKYVSNAKGGKSQGMASVQRKIPAEISPELKKQIQDYAVKSFKKMGCSGVARIDFMIDEETNTLYFNEINTIPGSLAFYLWEPIGIPYTELLDKMIELGLKRARFESGINVNFDTNILSNANFGGVKK